MKKENTGQQKQIYSIRKNKAYGASSVLIGLMGSAFLLSGLAPAVQAGEQESKPETKPADGSAVNGTNAPTIETNHLIIASQPKGSDTKSESTSTDNPKSNVENAQTNETKPVNSESPKPKEEPAVPVNPTEGAKPVESGTTEVKPSAETNPSKRAVSIVYKVRYVDRKSHKVVHEVTKTKTVETTEAKAKASVTEIGAELANDSQLENYYVPDGNPTIMTKEIVEGADNVFVYEVEGFGEAETPKERTVALKYTVEYVDGKSGLVLASEEKEEKVSTTETVAKKEVTIQPSLATNEKLKDWVLSKDAPASQKLTLTEGTVGKVTFKLQNSEGGKVRNKRHQETPNIDGQPYLTLENYTPGWESRESMTFLGNGQNTYKIVYKAGASRLPNNNIETDVELTQGAKDLGFTLDTTNGFLTTTLTPTRSMKGTYEVGFYVKSNPNIKVSGTITITVNEHYGFMIMNDQGYDYVPYFSNASSTSSYLTQQDGNYSNYRDSNYGGDLRNETPFYRTNSSSRQYLVDYVENNYPKAEVTIDGLRMPSTPFGYFMPDARKRVSDANQDTKRYYTMLPIFAPMDRSKDFANNDKQGLSITKFTVLEASDGVEAKLIDLRHDKAPDKGVYSNNRDFQTVALYNNDESYNSWSDYINTPYYLQFTKLPKDAGNYFATVEITDNLGLTKKIRLNFTTYENSISGSRSYGQFGISYALTTADALFEAKKEYVDEKNGTVTIPTSNKEQILGKVVLNKENAYIQPNEFPPGIELRTIEGKVDEQGHPTEAYVVKKENVKIPPASYSFKVTARDGHFQEGGVRSFNFDVVDAINPIADQRWRESSVPTPIPVSMENGSKITGIRVETSGGYAVFEGNPNDSNISIYGLKRTTEKQNARVYVTFTDGDGKTHTTFTDFKYEIEPNTVDDLAVTVTNSTQEISEGGTWQDMVITTTPSEGVTIKVDKTKLPIGTRVVGNVIKGKGLYEGVYEIPILAVKGDTVKSTAVHLTVKPGEFVVPPETVEVEVLSNDIKAITTGENGEIVKTPVPRYGLHIPKGAKVTYSDRGYYFSGSGMEISQDGTEITGTPSRVGEYTLNAIASWRASNGVTRTATTTYNINVTGLTPSLTISSTAQPEHPTDAYTDSSYRLIAPLGSPIPTITIKQEPHSRLDVGGLPEGLQYSYDEATHTGTITGTPTNMYYRGYVHNIGVSTRLDYNLVRSGEPDSIEKRIYIEVVPETSGLEINPAEQTFNANENMPPITVSGVDSRATVELDGAPEGVSYNKITRQITGTPTSGVGDYSFNVRAIMPESTGGAVTTKGVTLHVRAIEPSLSATPSAATVEATNRMPDITITKDPLSELATPTVTIAGIGESRPLSELGLSYDTTSRTITGTPTVVGHHTIHLSTTLSRRYTGEYSGVTKTLDIPVTVNAKSFDLNITNQTQTKTVLSPIDPVVLTVPEGINLTVDTDALPPGVTYNEENKRIEGTPSRVGTYNITVTARPKGITGNNKTATVTIQVNPLEATIGITPREQTVQVGTEITPVTVTPNTHASVYGTDALLNAVSGNASGVAESNIVNYFLGVYGLTYNPTNHTITGTPTKTGRIAFTFIARNSADLGGKEARETFTLNVVESLSKIPVITEAHEGSNVVKGSGVAGATVTVTLPTGDEKTALVSGDGSWSVDTTSPLGKGQSISARQKEVNKTMSNDISATVVANAGLELSKEPIVEAIIEGATTITGKGENGSTINVTLPNGTVKTTTVTDGRWAVTLESPVVKGDNILVSQTQPNKATSPSVSATVVPTITKGDKGEDGAAGRDGISPEVSIVEDSEGNHVITITQPGKTPITTKVKNGRDGRTPKVAITPIYEDSTQPRTRRARSVDSQPIRKQIGIHITVYYDNNNSGSYDNGDEVISEEDIYDGLDGNNGQDGKDILSGTSDPTSETGKEGDKYVNTTTGDIFVKKNGQWEREGNLKGPKGDKGEDGAAGATGAAGQNGENGQNGRDGKDILSGTSDPTSETGKEGDKYVNTTTGDIFVKKNGQWEREGNLKGPKGDKGETGAAGATGAAGQNGENGQNGRDGKDILSGTSDPTSETGKEGDKYVNTTTGDIFVKKNGQWEREGNLKGPKGDKGEDGAAGATGAAGQNGENGQNGRDGKDILSGTTDPMSESGKEGDKYVNTTTGDIFVKKNGQWEREGNLKGPKGDKGETGAAGATGAAGQNGQNGRDGKDILSGTTDPTSETGKEGDKYVNTTTGDIFVKKNGQWEREGNLKGPKGDNGKDGAAGETGAAGQNGQNGRDGKDILSGTTDPTSETGKEGDKYVNTTTGDIFVKKNGQWEREGNLKGAKGDKGDTPTITTQPGADGISTDIILTIPGKEPLTVNVKNGTNGRDGLNGKSLVAKKEGNETKIYVEDPANPGQPLDPTKPLATILDGLKGDKGEAGTNGVDGKSPVITMTDNGDGTHSIIIRNPDGSESTTKVKDGKDGKTATITTTENPDGSHTIIVINPDGASKEIVVRDGKTPKVEVTDNGNGTHTVKVTDGDGNVTNTIIKDGKDGKAATATTTENPDGSHTVTITNPDGTTNNFIVKNGRDGVDGRTPTATVRNNNDGSHTIVITNPDGVTTETTIRDGQSPKVTITDEQNGTHKITVLNGDGTTTETIIKDGKSPVATVTDNHDGTYTIRVENGNGTVSEMTVRDGKSPTAKVVNNGDGTHTVTIVNSDGTTTTTIVRDGQSPKLEVIDNHNGSHTIKVIGSDGKETSTTIFDGKSPTAKIVDNGDGTHTVIIVDSNGQQYTSIIRDGKDGKDGKSPTATVRNNNDGTHTITIINPDGSKTETIIKDGKDGKSPEVTVEDNGNGTHTITIINVNSIVYKTIIRDGKCGCNDKPGGHTPENPAAPKPENPTNPGGPTSAMPAPPVHDKPEFKGGVPGMPAVHEKPEYPGIPTNPSSDETTPGTPTPGTSTNPNPGVPTPGTSTNPTPVEPISEESTNPNPSVPTSVDSTEQNTGGSTSEGLTPSNPEKSSAVNEHPSGKLPETGTKAEYLPMLLASGALLTLYIGRRKEEEE